MKVKIFSLNVNGLRTFHGGAPKRRKLYTWLKRQKGDIYFLQETHSDPLVEQRWLNEWGGDGYFANGDGRSRGVAILFRPGFQITVNDVKISPEGRYLILSTEIGGVTCTLVNLYGPNIDNPSIFDECFKLCEDFSNDAIICGGDFNLCLCPDLDRITAARRITNNDRNKQIVQQFMEHAELIDIWRYQHPNDRGYTFQRTNQSGQSRIDFFIISSNFLHQSENPTSEIVDGYLADHKMVTLEVVFGKTTKGRSYWKMNDSLLQDETFIQTMQRRIPQIISENRSESVPMTLLLQTTLCVIRGEIIQFASRKKKARSKRLEDLDKQINDMMHDRGPESQVVTDLKKERDEIIESSTLKGMFRCRVDWRRYSEKGTKYFHNLVNRNRQSNTYKSMELVHSKQGERSEKVEDMLSEGIAFFGDLYAEKPPPSNSDRAESDISWEGLKNLDIEGRTSCEAPVTEAELTATLFDLQSGSSPGPDGFTAQFYKVFWPELKGLITHTVNEIFQIGRMPDGFKESIITLLPKKSKPKTRVSNLRPINLLNVIFKLITKMISNRMSKIIANLINEDQTGFIKGRFIGENIRLVIDVIQQAKLRNQTGLLVLCDMQKAYDSLNWKYMKKVIRRYGFGPNLCKWIDILYSNETGRATARITINGHLSQPFTISRGLRQGCPLSCNLFLLALEPLLNKLRLDNSVRGMNLGGVDVKLSAYADDVALILDGSQQSLMKSFQSFHWFESESGMKINEEKTTAMWIGSNTQAKEHICPEFKLKWSQAPTEYLGVTIAPDTDDIGNVNYPKKIVALRNSLNPWIRRSLTPFGRVHLLKSVALSKLVHLMSTIGRPTKAQTKEIESIMFKFIWGGSTDKISRTTMKNFPDSGGLNVPDIEAKADSLKISWVRKFLSTENRAKWKQVMSKRLKLTDTVTLFHCDYNLNSSHTLGIFWTETLQAWNKLKEAEQKDLTGEEILSKVLWHSKELNLESNANVNQWRSEIQRLNVMKIDDIYNRSEKRLYTANELVLKFRIAHFLIWHSIIVAIPAQWKQILATKRPQYAKVPAIYHDIEEVHSTAKWARKKLTAVINVTNPEKAERKWKNELNLGINFNWKAAYKLIYSTTNDITLRWLGLQIVHRILSTKCRLHIFRISENSWCERCKTVSESIVHALWYCPPVLLFWRELGDKFRYRRGLREQDIILLTVERYNGKLPIQCVRTTVVLGRHYVWRSRLSQKTPTIEGFKSFLERYTAVEKYIAINTGKLTKYNQLWEPIITCLQN